jgi:hypothetical protein
MPDLEMAMASKFACMISPNRNLAKKYVDAGDFMDVLLHNRNDVDVQKLSSLAEKLYQGGGAAIKKMVEDTLAGRCIKL